MQSIATFPKYEAYGDSESNSIGLKPANWGIQRAKWLFYKADRKPFPGDEIVTCFRDGQVTLRKNRRTEGFTNALKEHGYQRICKEDLVIHAMDAFAGAIGVSDSDGKSTPVYSACVPRKQGSVNSYYYAYYMRNLALSGFLIALSKGIRERSTDFRFNDFSELLLPTPSYHEQVLIAKFLDQKTAQIDEAIAIKEQQISLLKERKQIIIQQAVTQGLDPNVPMKDSGVDWIGKIPEHWQVKPLKYMLKLKNIKVEADKSSLEYLGMECINSFDGTKNGIKSEADGLSTYFQAGNILFGKLRPYLAKVYVADSEGICSTEFLVYEVHEGSNAFFSKLMLSNGFIGVVDASTYGSKMPRASSDFIGNLKLVNPPYEEQIRIATFIHEQNKLFDVSIAIQHSLIRKLKEYKVTLINSAVTGKIKITPDMVEQ